MENSFDQIDKEVQESSGLVGSTAVVAVVTPEKIVISNCGDSRAVLCRNGIVVPLSVDHKVSMVGTQFDVAPPGIPMPSNISLVNDGCSCPKSNSTGGDKGLIWSMEVGAWD